MGAGQEPVKAGLSLVTACERNAGVGLDDIDDPVRFEDDVSISADCLTDDLNRHVRIDPRNKQCPAGTCGEVTGGIRTLPGVGLLEDVNLWTTLGRRRAVVMSRDLHRGPVELREGRNDSAYESRLSDVFAATAYNQSRQMRPIRCSLVRLLSCCLDPGALPGD